MGANTYPYGNEKRESGSGGGIQMGYSANANAVAWWVTKWRVSSWERKIDLELKMKIIKKVWKWSVTRLPAGRSGARIPVGTKDFSLAQKSRTAVGPASLLFNGYRGSFPELKPGRDIYHSPPSSPEVKNEWSRTSTRPTRLYVVEWHNFTVLLIYIYVVYNRYTYGVI
jgi:hypothetical protein